MTSSNTTVKTGFRLAQEQSLKTFPIGLP